MRTTSLLLASLLLLAGCGTEPQEPGNPQAVRMLAFAAHGRSIADRLGGAGRALLNGHATARETRNMLAELTPQAVRLEEDIASTVDFGVPGRVPTLEGARELERAAGFLHSYASGHPDGLPLARAHLDAAVRALDGSAGALRPHLTEAQEPQLEHLEAPAPELR